MKKREAIYTNPIRNFRPTAILETGKQRKPWWTFRIFFPCSGKGPPGVRGAGRGGDRFFYLIKKRERPRGREGVCGELGDFLGGGGLNIFFRARNVHQEAHRSIICCVIPGQFDVTSGAELYWSCGCSCGWAVPDSMPSSVWI